MEDGECENGSDEEVGGEVRRPARMMNPERPSQREVDEHELTHLPYRSWCAICVKGKAKEQAHKRVKREDGMNEVHMDYMFMGPKDVAGETLPCLVVKDLGTKMVMAAAVPRKSTGGYIAARAVAFLQEIGYHVRDVVV